MSILLTKFERRYPSLVKNIYLVRMLMPIPKYEFLSIFLYYYYKIHFLEW